MTDLTIDGMLKKGCFFQGGMGTNFLDKMFIESMMLIFVKVFHELIL